MQMRTEKIGLRGFLFQRNVPGIGDGRCICRQGNQTFKHVLLECRLYPDAAWDVDRGVQEGAKRRREVFGPEARPYG